MAWAMINWANVINAIKMQQLIDQLNAMRRDAYRGIEAWENWVIHNDCLLQANNGDGEGGCEECCPDDYDLDFCPWK